MEGEILNVSDRPFTIEERCVFDTEHNVSSELTELEVLKKKKLPPMSIAENEHWSEYNEQYLDIEPLEEIHIKKGEICI